MDKDKKSLIGHIVNGSDLGKWARLELVNGRELTVEGCLGFIEYSECKIRLALISGCADISGAELLCDSYLNGAVLIRGKIRAIALLEATDEAVL